MEHTLKKGKRVYECVCGQKAEYLSTWDSFACSIGKVWLTPKCKCAEYGERCPFPERPDRPYSNQP